MMHPLRQSSPRSIATAMIGCTLSLGLVAIAFSAAVITAAAASSTEDGAASRDLEIVSERMIGRWTAEGRGLLAAVRRDLESLREDGSWPDVDYDDPERSAWRTVAHLHRLRSLATVLRTPGADLPDRARLRDSALRALRFWVERDFRNPNWWWNEIGIPMALGPTLLLLGDDVPADLRDRCLRILERATLGRGTGQNLVWLTEQALIRAAIERKPDEVAKAFARIAAEVRVTTEEGIQPDMSFHQHGAQLYSGGYGLGFSVDVPRLAALARGTAFAFGREKIEILADFLLDGQRWMVQGGIFDHAAVGRELTRRGAGRRGQALLRAAEDLLRVDPPRADELRAFAAALGEAAGAAAAGAPLATAPVAGAPVPGASVAAGRSAAGPVGHRHFWRSDFAVHRRAAYSSSVKMASRRTLGWEIVNSEGLRSHHTADGMHLLYRRGDEYLDIFGAWDWLSIPGATILQSPEAFRERNARGATSFVGGVSDGEWGVTAMDLAKGTLRARKAWFFFDREIVCLGGAIRCDAPEPVLTTANQCRGRGEVTTSEAEGRSASEGLWWALHDGVGYVVPAAVPVAGRPSVHIERGPRKGSWRDINLSYPDEPVTVDVFRIWIDHGPRPRDGTYLYAVVPGVDAGSLASYRWPADVLANGPVANGAEVQALRHRELGLVGAVFYGPGRLAIGERASPMDGTEAVPPEGPAPSGPPVEGPAPSGPFLEVDRPCILLLRDREGEVRLAAASPEQEEGPLVVTLSRRLRGEGATDDPATGGSRIVLELPGGPLAGRSVVRSFSVGE